MSLDVEPADPDRASLRFERLVADLCARLVNVSPEEVDAAVVDSQRQIVESLGLDRSALFEIADDGDLRLTLATTGWRVRGKGGAAELLGLKPTTLEGRLAKLGIRRPEK